MSSLEETLAFQMQCVGLKPVREHRFHADRRWRFDFAFPAERVAVEVEGGIFVKGRHSRGAGMRADMDKYNAACELGWRVLRFCETHIRKGEALEQIERVLKP